VTIGPLTAGGAPAIRSLRGATGGRLDPDSWTTSTSTRGQDAEW
jgi:hypothetical protein